MQVCGSSGGCGWPRTLNNPQNLCTYSGIVDSCTAKIPNPLLFPLDSAHSFLSHEWDGYSCKGPMCKPGPGCGL